MSDDDRFSRAMAAASPAARDAAFALAVLERAEAARFRAQGLRSVLRGAGGAAAAVGLLAGLLTLTPAQAAIEGFTATATLMLFVFSVRRAAARR